MDVDGLRRSWAAVQQLGDVAAQHFYAALFTLDPSLREMFPAAMGAQRDRLLMALGRIVSQVDDQAALGVFLAQLGRDHRRFDVQPQHYPAVGQALLHTLAYGLGPAWTPQLAEDWAAAYGIVSQEMMRAAEESARVEPARWEGKILSHERRAADIAVITVQVGGNLRYRPGQSIAVETHLRPKVWRYLSPANAPRDDGTVEFHVRAVPGGLLSPALVYQAQVGDVLHLSAPIGAGLTVPAESGPDLLLLAGGTGLAPLKAIVDQLTGGVNTRRVALIVGVSYRWDLYDLPALEALAQDYRWLTVMPTLSSDPALGRPSTVAEMAVRSGDWSGRQIYVCGSPAMVTATRQTLTEHGYPAEIVHVEQYDGTTYAPLQAGAGPESHYG